MSSCRVFLSRLPTHKLHTLSHLRLYSTQSLRITSLSPSQKLIFLRAYTSAPNPRTGQPQPQQSSPQRNQATGSAALQGRKYVFPERLVVYHAGTGRIMFLAVLKLTTIAVAVFFCGILVPAYIRDERPWSQVAALVTAGLIPLIFVAYTTSPIVSFLHVHLPPIARASRQNLERFVWSLPPQTRLEATTLSLIGKPRVSYFEAGHLYPSQQRFGVVNFARDTRAENASRKWYMYRAVGAFSMQGSNKGVKEGWVWDALRGRVERKGLGLKA